MSAEERPCTCMLVSPPWPTWTDSMPFRQLDLHCPEHGVYPDGAYCPACDHDDHRCPGCGEYLTHWVSVCAPCRRDYADPADPHFEVP